MNTDVLILGSGLAGSLLAHRIHRRWPELKITLIDKEQPDLHHKTWSFHRKDVEQIDWIQEWITTEWDGYTVHFPQYSREVPLKYCSIQSHLFFKKMNTELQNIERLTLSSANNLEITSPLIFDARGTIPTQFQNGSGFQKFLGLELELKTDHGLNKPRLMDTQIDQVDGHRFMYVLPWSAKRMLIEETHFSRSSEMDFPHYIEEIKKYAARQNWEISKIISQESGVLPIPVQLTENSYSFEGSTIPVGMRAGLFHPCTGYSLAHAVRLIDKITNQDFLTAEKTKLLVKNEMDHFKKQSSFYLTLNRFLLNAANPGQEYRMLQNFYRLNIKQISRFYAYQWTFLEKVKLFIARPPVSLISAFKILMHCAMVLFKNEKK